LKVARFTYIDIVDIQRLCVPIFVFWKEVVATSEGNGPVHEIEV
jgi:hypothetical protein